MVRRLSFVCVLLAFGAFGWGCASGGGGGGGGDAAPAAGQQQGLIIQVDNNVPGGGEMTIFIEPIGGGIRRPLGNIGPAETKNFQFDGEPGQYRLVTQGAASRTTSTFRIFANSTCVRWRTDQSTPQVLQGGCS